MVDDLGMGMAAFFRCPVHRLDLRTQWKIDSRADDGVFAIDKTLTFRKATGGVVDQRRRRSHNWIAGK